MKKCLYVLILVSAYQVLASEDSLYDFSWLDQDKEIYVLQNRKFRKKGSFHVSANGVKTISGPFIDAYGFNARAGYFFTEDWGVEFIYGSSSGSENSTAAQVRQQGNTRPFARQLDSYTGAMLLWAPFYSKINTFNQIFYYDWIFGLGGVSAKVSDNRLEFGAPSIKDKTTENLTGLIWNAGFRVYLSTHWSVRLDFTGIHAKPSSPKSGGAQQLTVKSDSLFNNYDLGVGLNYTF